MTITKETIDFISMVRAEYPKTYEWMRHKAKWEQIVLGAVAIEYKDYILALIEKEKAGVDIDA